MDDASNDRITQPTFSHKPGNKPPRVYGPGSTRPRVLREATPPARHVPLSDPSPPYKSSPAPEFKVSSFELSSDTIITTSSERAETEILPQKKKKMSSGNLQLPPGFRFHPTDEELVMHYLCKKCAGLSLAVPIIAEIDLYKFDPWQLPEMALYGEKEWYFFSPRDRKYPNGSRPNRAAGSGYWKATGADKPVGSPKPVAIKKALVFYAGKAPKGDKTNWIMHEYRLADVDRSARRKNSLRLDDWVLCRIYKKKGGGEKLTSPEKRPAGSRAVRPGQDQKPHVMQHVTQPPPPVNNDYFYFDTSDSLPKLHADSSCSEHVISPEFTCEREVQSQLRWEEFERALAAPFNSVNAAGPQFSQLDQVYRDPMQDVLMYLQKPF